MFHQESGDYNWNNVEPVNETVVPAPFACGIDPYRPKLSLWKRVLRFFGLYKNDAAVLTTWKIHPDGTKELLRTKKL